MTEKTADIQRLDYSKPPPGYVIEHDGPSGRWCWDSLDPRDGVETMGYAPGPRQDAAIADAWAHYKARNDPPGLPESAVDHSNALLADFEREVRAAAWARYDRRKKLADELDGGGYRLDGHPEVWPRILNWSNGQVAGVERWLVDSTAEMPEVLRG